MGCPYKVGEAICCVDSTLYVDVRQVLRASKKANDRDWPGRLHRTELLEP